METQLKNEFLCIKDCWGVYEENAIVNEDSFALGNDDVDKVDYMMTSSWNGYSTQCMMTLLYCILSSSHSANSPIGYHATHFFRRHRCRLVRTSP